MWRLYSVGFGVMAVMMIVAGTALFIVTLADPATVGQPESLWLVRALVAVALGGVAAVLAVVGWRQAGRS